MGNRQLGLIRKGLTILIVLGWSGVAYAGDVTIPNVFVHDTTAVPAEVNANFDAIETAVDDNDARIDTNITDIATNAAAAAAAATVSQIFYVNEQAGATDLDKINAALTACGAASGGVVMLPPSQLVIAHAGAGGNVISSVDGCDIIGHGSDHQGTAAPYTTAEGSSIAITGSGAATGINVTHGGVSLKNFTLYMVGAGTNTVGIKFTSLNEAHMSDVAVFGDFAIRLGTGIALDFALKSTFDSVFVSDWGTGMSLETTSNANQISNSSFRQNLTGIAIKTGGCDSLSLDTNTVENGVVGLHIESGADCKVTDISGHWEQDTYGVQADRKSIWNESLASRYYGFGSVFSGTMDAGTDLVRTATSFNQRGPDILVGGLLRHCVTYTNGNDIQLINVGSIGGDCTGNVNGTAFYSSTNCDVDASKMTAVRGDFCYQEDTQALWICEPQAGEGTEGVCDTAGAGEWINLTAGVGQSNTHSSTGGGGVDLQAIVSKVGLDLKLVSLDSADFTSSFDVVSLNPTLDLLTSGTIRGNVYTVTTTDTTYAPTADELRGTFHISNNVAGTDYSLPTVTPGMGACFYDLNGGGVVVIDAAAGDEIYLNGTGVGVAEAIDSAGGLGDYICLMGISTSEWVTLGRSGTWVDGGAD